MLIHGTIRTRDGEPIDGAAVVFVVAPSDVPDVGALTGSDGSFVLSATAAGLHRLAVRADGHVDRELDVLVGEGADVVVSTELDPRPPVR